MPDRLLEECIAWVESHIPKTPTAGTAADNPSVDGTAETTPESKL